MKKVLKLRGKKLLKLQKNVLMNLDNGCYSKKKIENCDFSSPFNSVDNNCDFILMKEKLTQMELNESDSPVEVRIPVSLVSKVDKNHSEYEKIKSKNKNLDFPEISILRYKKFLIVKSY